MSPRLARSARVAVPVLAVYCLALGLAWFWPNSDRQATGVLRLGQLLHGLGVPAGLTGFARLEVLANAAVVAPISLIGSFCFPRVDWRAWTAYGFLGSLTVEVVQAVFLPGRVASFSDVVANTAGMLAGAVLFLAFRPMLRNRRVR